MTKLADDVCAEIRSQFEAAEHFKRLWMQTNDELERAKTRTAKLDKALLEIRYALMCANELPQGPINDTIWMNSDRPETLFDFIERMIKP